MEYNNLYQSNISNYRCEICDYNSRNKSNYLKHINTAKHKTRQKYYEKLQQIAIGNIYSCICSKSYKHRASLFNHKKVCKVILGENSVEDLGLNGEKKDKNDINKKKVYLI